jgi:hypothetical protein
VPSMTRSSASSRRSRVHISWLDSDDGVPDTLKTGVKAEALRPRSVMSRPTPRLNLTNVRLR